jgi:predicted Rossmann fold flavoprotein
MLMHECAEASVDVRMNCEISAVSKAEVYSIESNLGAFEAPALVLASGGLSIPKLGASDFAFRIAEQFSIPIIAPRPGLVPLTFSESDLAWMRPLSGVSTEITAHCGNATFREAALFTHRGLSGPAILQISSYWREGQPISIDWLPGSDEDALVAAKRARPKAHLKTALAGLLPARLADTLAQDAPSAALADIKDQILTDFARKLKTFPLTPIGTEGYAKAEVTLGGVDTNAMSQKTMQCNAQPGLFFIGECVDVTGWLGGFNFQWAWSSAWAAAQAL